MINLTKEQITEALQRFRYFGYSLYFTKEGGDMFRRENRNPPLIHKDRTFFISAEENGLFRLQYTDSDIHALVRVANFTAPPNSPSLIDNIGYGAEIMNKGDLSKEDYEFFGEVSIFCGSFFQRLQFFTFLSRMADITLDRYVDSLFNMQKN